MHENDERILVLANTRRDAQSCQEILIRHGLTALHVNSIDEMLAEIQNGVGALLVAREMLQDRSLDSISATLQDQPSWSQIPVVVLAGHRDIELEKAELIRSLKSIANTTFLERPVRVATLISVMTAAVVNRRRQYEVRDLLLQLEASRADAVRANQAKSEFLANMSHEIRTPLGAVMGFADLMSDATLTPPERLSYARTIRRNGQLLSVLIDDILDLAKIEAGRLELHAIQLSLFELVSDVASSLEPNASQKNLALLLDASEVHCDLIEADPVRLKQILVNLIGNAIKFTSAGCVRLRVSSHIQDSQSCRLAFEVSDTGIGISPDQEHRLFQAFSQADGSITRAFGGTGLGLALSRRLARAMGGELVLIQSTRGQGSVFGLKLPVRRANSQPQARSVPRSAVNLAGVKVLLVEDSPDLQFLVERILSLAGAQVAIACDGQEGIQKALGDEFDVVLMDVQMPRMGGREAVRELRRRGYDRPVLALTAHALNSDREISLQAGYDDCLTKPIEREHLLRRVGEVARAHLN